MADLQSILNKFTELGIKNKGLTVDAPQQGQALQEQNSNSQSTDANSHARMVAESVRGKHIPGISDTSANDMAALAGVGNTTPNVQKSVEVVQNYPQDNVNDKWRQVDDRLSKIENTLAQVFESLQKITEMTDSDYNAKRKAIYDLEMNPALKDKESKDAIKQRKAQLEKERKQTTKESLEKGFASFLKEFE